MMMLAVTIAAITLTYPILRTADLVPVDQLVDWFARNVEEERAESLKFRFEQEYILLGRAMERPWLGWGLFGRNHLHSVTTGEMTTITDGYWVIVLGMSGIIGFLGQFGLLTFPVFAASRALRRMRMSSDRILLSALALINAILALDLIPNAFPSPFQWFLCGGLLGLIIDGHR